MGAHQRLPPSGRPGCIMLDHTTMGGAANGRAAARTEAAGAVGRASNLARPYVYNRIAASRIVLSVFASPWHVSTGRPHAASRCSYPPLPAGPALPGGGATFPHRHRERPAARMGQHIQSGKFSPEYYIDMIGKRLTDKAGIVALHGADEEDAHDKELEKEKSK